MVCIVAVPASLLKARCFSQVARGGSKAKGGGASEAATQNIVGYEYIQLQGKKQHLCARFEQTFKEAKTIVDLVMMVVVCVLRFLTKSLFFWLIYG